MTRPPVPLAIRPLPPVTAPLRPILFPGLVSVRVLPEAIVTLPLNCNPLPEAFQTCEPLVVILLPKVSKSLSLLVIPPVPIVSALPLIENALAAAKKLNVIEPIDQGLFVFTTGASRTVPPNWTALTPKFEGGKPPTQFAPVFQLLSIPPPFQSWPTATDGSATRTSSSPNVRPRPHEKRGMAKAPRLEIR